MKSRSFLSLLFLCLFSLGVPGGARATNLHLEGPCVRVIGPSTVYGLSCTQVAMTYARINNLDGNVSGPLSLELWAVIPNTAQGYKMATYADGSTVAGHNYLASRTVTTALSLQPPTGTYGVRMVLKESGVVRSYYDFKQFSDPSQWNTIQFGNITFSGTASWAQNGSQVTLGLPQVTNASEGGTSGQLRVQLFATSAPYMPDGQPNPAPGALLATYAYQNALCGHYSSFNAGSISAAYTAPPAGTYYSTMILTEYTTAGWERKDSVNFPNTFTVGTPPATVTAPAFTPGAGTYSGCVDVTMTCSTGGAAIRYTTDGTTPTASSPLYSAPVRLTTTKTVKARAFLAGSTDSAVSTGLYTVNAAIVATPVVTPADGAYTGPVQVSIESATPGAAIRYTTNGAVPTASSTLYTGPFILTSGATVKVIAFKDCWQDSALRTAAFTINTQSTVGTPVISPNGGTYAGNTQITLSGTPADATIRFTTDGTTPTASSPAYAAPFTLTTSATVLARGFKNGWQDSTIASATFTLPAQQTVYAPVISPGSGTYAGSVTVTLSTYTPGATIYYVTNGTVPSAASTPYTGPFVLTSLSTVNAIAVKSGWNNSSIVSARLDVTSQTVAAPVIAPAGGQYECEARIYISTATPDATIYYTLDGQVPNEGLNSARYNGPFKMYEGATMRARAFKAGYTPSTTTTASFDITACAASPVFADCAWDVKEYRFVSAGTVRTLAEAAAIVADPYAQPTYQASYQSAVINRHDPGSPGISGFFPGDEPFASDNLTPHGLGGLNGGDDDDFVLFARCRIVVTQESDYTLGFSSDDGARLRIGGTVFTSSMRLNTANPANPAHSGNVLQYPAGTGNSDTLGVCHLMPGTYDLDFLTWEGTGGGAAEVFAARGAKTAMDSSFRLIGHVPSGIAGNSLRLTESGWHVTDLRGGITNFNTALQRMYDWWTTGTTVTGIRFTSGNDFAERDPITFILEGSRSHGLSGPWTQLASLGTQLSTTRGASSPVINVPNTIPWASYRLTFPTVRTPASANSMQIAEVEFFDADNQTIRMLGSSTSANSTVVATSTNSPAGQTVDKAFDGLTTTKYLNFDKLNTGITIMPAASTFPWLCLHDADAGEVPHGAITFSFAGETAGDENNFAIGARAGMVVTQPGEYTFCIYSDDGARLRIKGSQGWSVRGAAQPLVDGMQITGCCADVFGTVNLSAGTYEVEVIYNEMAGGATLGVFAAYGRHSAWSPLLFTPLGENSGTSAPDAVPFTLRAPTIAQPPVNDDYSAPVTGYEVNAAGCNTGAIVSAGEPTPYNMEKTIWWTWFSPVTGKVTVDTIGSSFDTVLAVYDFPPPPFAPLLYASDDNRGGNGTSQLTFNAVANTYYKFQVGSKPGGATGMVRLHIAPAPVLFINDGFSSAVNLGGSPSASANGSNEGASIQSGEPVFGVGRTIWYTWIAPYTGEFIVNTAGSNFDTTLAIYTGTAVNALTLIQGNDNALGQQSSLRFRAGGGVTYRIAVDGGNTGRAEGYAVLNILPIPRLLSFGLTGVSANRKFNLTWSSEPYTSYRIQKSTSLTAWTDVMKCFSATGTQTTLDIRSTPADGPRMYFRVIRE